MRTTEIQIKRGEDRDGRFLAAGRLLALAEVIVTERTEGQTDSRNPILLRTLAAVVAEEGIDYARGWLAGWWYVTGAPGWDTRKIAEEVLA